jgi:hypothetical protein
VSTDVSEEHIASIFRVEKRSSARNQHESRWQALNRLHGVISQKIVLFIPTAVRTSNLTTAVGTLKRNMFLNEEPGHGRPIVPTGRY